MLRSRSQFCRHAGISCQRAGTFYPLDETFDPCLGCFHRKAGTFQPWGRRFRIHLDSPEFAVSDEQVQVILKGLPRRLSQTQSPNSFNSWKNWSAWVGSPAGWVDGELMEKAIPKLSRASVKASQTTLGVSRASLSASVATLYK